MTAFSGLITVSHWFFFLDRQTQTVVSFNYEDNECLKMGTKGGFPLFHGKLRKNDSRGVFASDGIACANLGITHTK